MAHDIPNLGIIDGSVFVTSGPVNPTSTIMALAARTGDYLARNLERIAPAAPGRTFSSSGAPSRDTTYTPLAEPAPLEWTPDRATRFAALGDALIPADGDLPPAGQLAVERGMAQKAFHTRPDLHAALDRALAAGPESFNSLIATDMPAWTAFTTLLSAAYYGIPEAAALHGYFGQQAKPAQPDRYPAYVEEGLLDHVLEPDWRARWSAGVALSEV
jgi:hypothetical protein